MTELLVPVLIASLVGSVHCAGMCGAFVTMAGGLRSTGSTRARGQLAYHVGRLAVYATFGAVAGGVGRMLDIAGSLSGIARVSALVAGVTMVGWGLMSLLPKPRLVTLGRGPRRSSAGLAKLLLAFDDSAPIRRGLVMGLATTLIPCGWLYAFVVTAAGTGAILSGMAVMLAFWAGTIPMLFGVSWGIQAAAARLGGRLRTLSACGIAVAGVCIIVLRVGAPSLPGAAATSAGAAEPAACPLHAR